MTTTTAVPSVVSDIQSQVLSVRQRIAALTGSAASASTTAAGDPSETSTTFAGVLAQEQAQLDATGSGSASDTTGATTASTTGSGVGTGASGSDVVADAVKYLGTPYKWGGTDPSTGLDCSGFVQRVMADEGITVPRTAAEQATVGTAVPSLAQAQPGDILVFEGGHHVGIYVGDGKMIDSPKTGDVVKVQDVWATPDTIRRVTTSTDSSGAGSSATSSSTSSALSTDLASYLRSAVLGSSSLSSVASALGTDASDGSDGSGASGSDSELTSLLSSLSGSGTSSSLLSSLGGSSSSSSDLTSLLSSLTGASSGSTALSALSLDDAADTSGSTGSAPSTGVSAYQPLFAAATSTYGLPQGLLAAVAQVESGGDAGAVSSAGAQGLMQLMPATAAGLGVDPTDPAQAVDGAARLLKADLARFGTVPLALAAYNAGAGNVAKYGGVPPFAETQAYVRKVAAAMSAPAATATTSLTASALESV